MLIINLVTKKQTYEKEIHSYNSLPPIYSSNIGSTKNRPMDIVLKNIEALAAGESIYDYRQPRTVACDDYQEGWGHTASIERICEFCAAPYSCTPKACGEEF